MMKSVLIIFGIVILTLSNSNTFKLKTGIRSNKLLLKHVQINAKLNSETNIYRHRIRFELNSTNKRNSYISNIIESTENRLKTLNIPNMLTISRILSIPIFMLSFIYEMNTVAFGIYVLSCITDYLDGYLARRWNQITPFGTFLDPVSDKLMVAVALILLTSRFATSLYNLPVALIICREIAISSLREWMAEKGKRNIVKVGNIGKLKTVFQMISTSLLLLVVPNGSSGFDLCIEVLNMSKALVFTSGIVTLYLSTFLTIYSGYIYLKAAWPFLIEKDEKSLDK